MDYGRYTCLKAERDDGILTVRLNRPEALNAINADLHTELSTIFADIASDTATNGRRVDRCGRVVFRWRGH